MQGTPYGVAKRLIGLQSLLIHAMQNGHAGIDVVINPIDVLVLEQSVKSADNLLDRASPRNWHRQKQRIQSSVIESFTNISSGGNKHPLLVAGHTLDLRCKDFPLSLAHTTLHNEYIGHSTHK